MKEMRDVFLCHASEDKELVVRPLFQALRNENISCWYDEAEIRWGHSITQTVNQGLGIFRYVIVVLSRAFLSKNWPQRELNAVLNLEASTGEVRVLPLVVGDAHDEVFSAYPLLNDKRYLTWPANPVPIVDELRKLLPLDNLPAAQSSAAPIEPSISIPMPRSAKVVTERDKDQFVTSAFLEMKGYFQRAVAQLKGQVQGIDADFSELTNLSFMCSFYKDGTRRRQCKIWLGSMFSSSQSIYCLSDRSVDPHANNSFNEGLNVVEYNGDLALEPTMCRFGRYDEKVMTANEGAEYLWKMTIEYL